MSPLDWEKANRREVERLPSDFRKGAKPGGPALVEKRMRNTRVFFSEGEKVTLGDPIMQRGDLCKWCGAGVFFRGVGGKGTMICLEYGDGDYFVVGGFATQVGGPPHKRGHKRHECEERREWKENQPSKRSG